MRQHRAGWQDFDPQRDLRPNALGIECATGGGKSDERVHLVMSQAHVFMYEELPIASAPPADEGEEQPAVAALMHGTGGESL